MNIHSFLDKWYSQDLFCLSQKLISEASYTRKTRLNIVQLLTQYLDLHVSRQVCLIPFLQHWQRSWVYLCGDQDIRYTKIGQSLTASTSYGQYYIIKQADHNVHLCQPDILLTYINDYISLLK